MDLKEEITHRQETENGELKISPTALDAWHGCGFSYLLGTVLRIDETDYDLMYSSPRVVGILFHRVLASLAEALDQQLTGGLRENIERGREILDEEIARVFSHWNDPVFILPAWEDEKRRVVEYLAGFLDIECKYWDGTCLTAVEESLEIESFAPGVTLHGRIDRILERDGAFCVIDYKKRLYSNRARMVDQDNNLLTFQVPFYLLLAEHVHGAVNEALYYDITGQKYHQVFGGSKPWFDSAERGDLLNQTKKAVEIMSRSIQKGSYTVPKPRGSCDGCRFRAVCREKYIIR